MYYGTQMTYFDFPSCPYFTKIKANSPFFLQTFSVFSEKHYLCRAKQNHYTVFVTKTNSKLK